MRIAAYIAVMAIVTYLIRMLPMTLFRRKIRSPFIASFLFYIPYAVLAAMTIPAIFSSTGNFITALAGTAVALVLAYCNLPMIAVALAAAAAAFLTGLFL